MTVKLDIDAISEILAGDDTQQKLDLLEELDEQLPEWDIFPVEMILAGVSDPDAEVRSRTFDLLRYTPEKLCQKDLLKILELIEDGDMEVKRQIVEDSGIFASQIQSETLRKALHYLKHPDAEVRETAVQVFTELSHCFTEEIFLELAEMGGQASLAIQESIADFLRRNGQESLIQS